MGKYVLQRVIYMVVTLWVIATFTFFLMHTLPGSPLKNEERLSPELQEQILAEYGLDQPLPIQYVQYFKRLLVGDLGISFYYDGRKVTDLIAGGFPVSAHIGLQAILIGVLVGVPLGCIAALRRGTAVDNAATLVAILGVSVPSFVLAALLSYYVGVVWGILPAGLWGSWKHSILPSLSLSVLVIAQMARFIRTEMLEVLGQDYIKTAKAKGLSQSVVVMRHALRNSLIPAITILGPLMINILTGSLVVEHIFAIPGMGEMFVQSIVVNDYTGIMGVTLFYSLLIIIVIFVIDILYGLIDPRIRIAGVKE